MSAALVTVRPIDSLDICDTSAQPSDPEIDCVKAVQVLLVPAQLLPHTARGVQGPNGSSVSEEHMTHVQSMPSPIIAQRRYLEEELAKKYRDAAPATLALLQDRCAKLSAELALAESKLHAMQDVTSLRTAGSPSSLHSLILLAHQSHT